MISFDHAVRRIVQYRICLEGAARQGLIAPTAAARLDRCFGDLVDRIESARIELEGTDPGHRDNLAGPFATACKELARRMFLLMCREPDSQRLIARSESLHAEAVQLADRLRARLHRAA